MRKTHRPRLLLTAVAIAAGSLFAINARAAVGDIYETNEGVIIRFHGTPITFAVGLSNPKGIVFDGLGHLFVVRRAPDRLSVLTHRTVPALPSPQALTPR